MFNFFLLLFLGYLIGSISPGYFFGRLVKGIDIRNYNRRNTGATNTYLTIGPVYGIIAGIFDFAKAAFVYFISFLYLGPDLAILPGLAAVLGHIFPFYLGFRGGRGVASLYGILILTLIFSRSFFSLLLFIGIVIYALKITDWPVRFDASFRRLIKLAALALPLVFIWKPEFIIFIVSIFLIAVLSFDLLRFLIPKLNLKYLGAGSFAKPKESKTFSGYTLFLLSAFLLFSYFPKEIAVLSLTFFILADLLAPLAGRWFLPKVIFRDKTLGGALMIFGITFISGIFLSSLTPLTFSLKFIISGAVLTALLDQLSFILDDNILVPLGLAIGLSFLQNLSF